MIFTSPVLLCNICLTNAGLDPPAVVLGGNQSTQVFLPPPEDSNAVNAINAYLGGPPAACPHASQFASPEQVAASDSWAEINAKLASLPAAPTPPAVDPYASIRARLTANLAAALTAANNLGGLV